MNKILKNIQHKMQNDCYRPIAGVYVTVTDELKNPEPYIEERRITTRVDLYSESIVPPSMVQHTERQHFKRIQQLMYGDLNCIVNELRFTARKNNDQRSIDLCDDMLTDMGYLS